MNATYKDRCYILNYRPPDITDLLQLQVWARRIPFPNNPTGVYPSLFPSSLLPHLSFCNTPGQLLFPFLNSQSQVQTTEVGGMDVNPKAKGVATKSIFLLQRVRWLDIHMCFHQNTQKNFQEESQPSIAWRTSLP